ncbi:MAG: hypothetical protein ACYDHN_03285 [Solirubrobacteraceae bacterium]
MVLTRLIDRGRLLCSARLQRRAQAAPRQQDGEGGPKRARSDDRRAAGARRRQRTRAGGRARPGSE